MFLFIFESIGTSELILVGIVALIFLGPRRLPDLARKAGKLMAEFRGTANEFKETWQREVDFEEEAKALDLNRLEAEAADQSKPKTEEATIPVPAITEVDASSFQNLPPAEPAPETDQANTQSATGDKKNWL